MAIRFDSTSDYIERTTSVPVWNLYTVSFWVYLSATSNDLLIFTIADSGHSTTNDLYIDSTAHISSWNGGAATAGGVLSNSTWYHVAYTKSASLTTIYLDGAQSAQHNQGSTFTAGVIGWGQSGASFNGRIAALKIWDATLTLAEIQAERFTVLPQRYTNLNGWYPTWPGSSVRGADYSGNGRNFTEAGTLTDEDGPPVSWGAPYWVVGPSAAGGAVALTVANMAVAVAAEATALVQHNALTVANQAVAVAADNVALTQHYTLTVANQAVAVAADNLSLAPPSALTVQNMAVGVSAQSLTIAEHKLFYMLDSLAGTSAHLALQEAGTAPTAARATTGWIVGTLAPSVYARMDSQNERASAQHTSTVQPDGGPNNTLGDCFRTAATLNGTFLSGNWSFSFEVQGETRATSTHDGRLRLRLWRDTAQTGASAVEITGATQVTSAYTDLTNSVKQTITLTFDPGAATLTNEYLFVQVAHEITGAGNFSNSDTHLCVGSVNTITTAGFTVPVSLTVANMAVAVTSEAPVLTQHNALSVANQAIAVASEAPALTQHNALVVANQSVAVAADNVTLGLGATALTVANVAVAVSAESVALTQHNLLAAANIAVAVAVDALALTQHYALTVADVAVAVAAEAPSLTQHYALTVQNQAVAVAAESPVLGVGLTVADLAVAIAADSLALTQHYALTVQNMAVAVAAENIALGLAGVLAVQNMAVAVSAASPDLVQHSILAVQNQAVAVASEAVTITQHNTLTVANVAVAVAAGTLTLTPNQALTVANMAVAVAAEAITLGVAGALDVQNVAVSVGMDSPALVQHNTLTVANMTVAVGVANVQFGGLLATIFRLMSQGVFKKMR